MAAVEELSAARAQERKDVLQIRRGACRGAERRRIQRAAADGEENEARETAADLEAPGADVLVRYAVARQMEHRPEHERGEPRPGCGTGRGARRHVECDDHGCRRSRLGPRGDDPVGLSAREMGRMALGGTTPWVDP